MNMMSGYELKVKTSYEAKATYMERSRCNSATR
jgi:hypothetical protein